MASRPGRTFMLCPHCDSGAVVRTSYALTPMIRESLMACRNPVCGHTFAVISSIDRTISPSATPREGVALRVSTFAEIRHERERLKAQAKQAAAATAAPPVAP